MKFLELNLQNQFINFEGFKIVIFGLKKLKKVDRLILHCQKNECCDNCVDYFLNSRFKRIKKLQKLELDLSNYAPIRMKLKIKEQHKC